MSPEMLAKSKVDNGTADVSAHNSSWQQGGNSQLKEFCGSWGSVAKLLFTKFWHPSMYLGRCCGW